MRWHKHIANSRLYYYSCSHDIMILYRMHKRSIFFMNKKTLVRLAVRLRFSGAIFRASLLRMPATIAFTPSFLLYRFDLDLMFEV
jgi:hypothetical protein